MTARARTRTLALLALLLLQGGCVLGEEGSASAGESVPLPPKRSVIARDAGRADQTGSIGAAPAAESFETCVEGLWPAARSGGVSRATFDIAFRGVAPDPKILALTTRQAEFSRPIWEYVDTASSDAKIARGRAFAAEYKDVLADIERRYGVDRRAVMGVWGMESNFGSNTGGTYVVKALATLACAGYRGDYFRNELLVSLRILENAHIDRATMLGSWAGAMGQTQFMPTSYMTYAVDYDRNGVRDIWTSVPDALASTANYLAGHGWIAGLPWGYEVRLPENFRFDRYGRSSFHAFAHWKALGLRRADGGALPASGEASVYLPAGARGPAFLITRNFAVIKAYNASDSYALGVGHLGDRIFGGTDFRAAWPRGDTQLSREDRYEIQRSLIAIGYDVGKTDGHLGEKTSEAIRAFQARHGMLADGYATPDVLARLRSAPR